MSIFRSIHASCIALRCTHGGARRSVGNCCRASSYHCIHAQQVGVAQRRVKISSRQQRPDADQFGCLPEILIGSLGLSLSSAGMTSFSSVNVVYWSQCLLQDAHALSPRRCRGQELTSLVTGMSLACHSLVIGHVVSQSCSFQIK